MIYFVLFVIAIGLACFISYKKGEIHELHKMRAEFKRYLETHSVLHEVLGPGLEAAEHIIDQIEEKEKL